MCGTLAAVPLLGLVESSALVTPRAVAGAFDPGPVLVGAVVSARFVPALLVTAVALVVASVSEGGLVPEGALVPAGIPAPLVAAGALDPGVDLGGAVVADPPSAASIRLLFRCAAWARTLGRSVKKTYPNPAAAEISRTYKIALMDPLISTLD